MKNETERLGLMTEEYSRIENDWKRIRIMLPVWFSDKLTLLLRHAFSTGALCAVHHLLECKDSDSVKEVLDDIRAFSSKTSKSLE